MFNGKLRLVAALMAAVACVVVSAVASASASASLALSTEACKSGVFSALCWETAAHGEALKELVGEGPLTVAQASSNVELKGTLGGEAIEIECTTGTADSTTLVQPSPLTEDGKVTIATVLYSGCTLLGKLKEKCKIPTEEPTNAIVGEFSLTEPGDIKFVNTANSGVFIKIKIEQKSKCPTTILGTHNVTGEQLATINEPTVDLKAHTLTMEAKSGLKLGENEASYFENFTVEVPEEAAWDAVTEA